MQTVLNGIHLTIQKTKEDWGVYPDGALLPVWMRWDGNKWVFSSDETPQRLKDIEQEISNFILSKEKK